MAVAGVAALGRAVQHLHLGWAYVGWLVRVPGVAPFLQVVVDAVGGGPLAEPIGGPAGRSAGERVKFVDEVGPLGPRDTATSVDSRSPARIRCSLAETMWRPRASADGET